MDRKNINGREVFVSDAHHEILEAWAECGLLRAGLAGAMLRRMSPPRCLREEHTSKRGGRMMCSGLIESYLLNSELS